MNAPLPSVYTAVTASESGANVFVPLLPLVLSAQNAVSVSALLDTGASVNVLPYDLGVSLGLVWENHIFPLKLAGNLSPFEAKAAIVRGKIGTFPEITLAFAWTKQQDAPLILGHTNFFQQFDVCFYANVREFEISPSPSQVSS